MGSACSRPDADISCRSVYDYIKVRISDSWESCSKQLRQRCSCSHCHHQQFPSSYEKLKAEYLYNMSFQEACSKKNKYIIQYIIARELSNKNIGIFQEENEEEMFSSSDDDEDETEEKIETSIQLTQLDTIVKSLNETQEDTIVKTLLPPVLPAIPEEEKF